MKCAACGDHARGNCSIHRDGFDQGPEVELCDACGMSELPTCEDLWRQIAERSQVAPAVTSLSDARKRREEKP